MRRVLDPQRRVGFESRKAYAARCASGFWHRYMAGHVVLDIGWRGGDPEALPMGIIYLTPSLIAAATVSGYRRWQRHVHSACLPCVSSAIIAGHQNGARCTVLTPDGRSHPARASGQFRGGD